MKFDKGAGAVGAFLAVFLIGILMWGILFTIRMGDREIAPGETIDSTQPIDKAKDTRALIENRDKEIQDALNQ